MLKRIGFGALIVAMGIGVSILSSCKGNGSLLGPNGDKPSSYFNTFVQPIFTDKCMSCHFPGGPGYSATGGAATGLDLSPGVAYNKLVGIPAFQNTAISRVEPSSASNSYLIEKLNDNPGAGGKMPLGGSLSADEIKIITDWVNCGAPGSDGPPTCSPVVDTNTVVTVPANFFIDSIQPIFANNCLQCHGFSAGLTLHDSAYTNLVNVPSSQDPNYTRVIPGSPDESLLYNKISSATPLVGGHMPISSPDPLIVTDPDAVDAIYRWIAAGAPEN